MRILICDDDLSITQSLSQIIKTYFNKKKVNNRLFIRMCGIENRLKAA